MHSPGYWQTHDKIVPRCISLCNSWFKQFIYNNLLRTLDMLRWERADSAFPTKALEKVPGVADSYGGCFPCKDREVPGCLCSHSSAVLLRGWLVPEYRNPAPLRATAPTEMCTLNSRAPPWTHTEVLPAWHSIPLYLFSFYVFFFLTGFWLFCLNTFHTHKFLSQGQSVSGTTLKRYPG